MAVADKEPIHSLFCLYWNCAWYKNPPSPTFDVIAGAVNANLSAWIFLIISASLAFS